jgi:hypothetical protein
VILFLILSVLVGEILIQFGPETVHHTMFFCDPGTVAAVAAPMVIGAFMPKPSAPKYEAPAGPNMFPEYQQKLLESAYNPQSDIYRVAGEQQAAMINRQLARRGLANSGMGVAAQTAAANDLANRFLQSETDRRAKAYQTAVAPEAAAYQGRLQASQSAYEAAADAYKQELAGRDAFLGGIGQLAGQVGKYGGEQGWFTANQTPGTLGGMTGDQWFMKYGHGSVP